MNELSGNIIIGVISGLLATLLAVGFRHIWLSILVPWFEELVYKDAKIEGVWYGISGKGLESERYDIISVKRSGHHIEARMTCSAGGDSGTIYCIIGSFRNLILSATYETENRQGLDRGSMTLMLTENGRKLVGILAFYGDNNHEILHATQTWYRYKTEFDQKYKEQLARIKDEEKLLAMMENQTKNQNFLKMKIKNEPQQSKEHEKVENK